MSQITLNLPDKAAAELAEASRETNRNPEDVASELLQRALLLRRFDRAKHRLWIGRGTYRPRPREMGGDDCPGDGLELRARAASDRSQILPPGKSLAAICGRTTGAARKNIGVTSLEGELALALGAVFLVWLGVSLLLSSPTSNGG